MGEKSGASRRITDSDGRLGAQLWDLRKNSGIHAFSAIESLLLPRGHVVLAKKNWKRSKKVFKWIDVLIRAAGTQKQGARWKKDGVGRI